jgi:hypothetical protein
MVFNATFYNISVILFYVNKQINGLLLRNVGMTENITEVLVAVGMIAW